MWDRLLVDCNIATMDPAVPGAFGAIENGAIGISDGRIVRVGRRTELAGYQAKKVEPLHGAWITPGLVDCHTHLVFGGNRAGEFEQRLEGATYEEIARAGGGIAATVKATRAASLDELVEASRPRLQALMRAASPPSRSVGLRARHRDRAEDAPRRQGARRERDGARRAHPARAPRLPPEFATGARSSSAGDRTPCFRPPRPGPGQRGRRLLRGIGFTPTRCGPVRGGARHGLGSSSMPSSSAIFTAPRSRPTMAPFGRPSRACRRGRRRRDGARRHGRGAAARRLLCAEETKAAGRLLRRYGVPMAVATDCNPGTSPVLSPT
jgi:imidazolonepropionase